MEENSALYIIINTHLIWELKIHNQWKFEWGNIVNRESSLREFRYASRI